VTSILELKIGLEGTFADGTGGVDRREEADLVVGFRRMPLAETIHMDVLGISATFTGSDHWVFFGIFFIEAHVADGAVAGNFLRVRTGLGDDTGIPFAVNGVIGIFCRKNKQQRTVQVSGPLRIVPNHIVYTFDTNNNVPPSVSAKSKNPPLELVVSFIIF
jgi:hypothetical protein